MHGRGIFKCKEGEYQGEFYFHKVKGFGKFKFSFGAAHMGEFAAGKREKRGVFSYSEDCVYEGEFSAGVPMERTPCCTQTATYTMENKRMASSTGPGFTKAAMLGLIFSRATLSTGIATAAGSCGSSRTRWPLAARISASILSLPLCLCIHSRRECIDNGAPNAMHPFSSLCIHPMRCSSILVYADRPVVGSLSKGEP
jgi:hypothetical protein